MIRQVVAPRSRVGEDKHMQEPFFDDANSNNSNYDDKDEDRTSTCTESSTHSHGISNIANDDDSDSSDGENSSLQQSAAVLSTLDCIVSKLAIWGDSPWALGLSATALFVAISISFCMDKAITVDDLLAPSSSSSSFLSLLSLQSSLGTPALMLLRWALTPVDPYQQLGPVPEIGPTLIYEVDANRFDLDNISSWLTNDMRHAFDKDGVIAIRGLIPSELIQRVLSESAELITKPSPRPDRHRSKYRGTQFHTVRHGAMFDNKTMTQSALLQLALQTPLPAIAASLLQLDPQNETLRVLRDILLVKDDDAYVCGWHVDDMGFWPAMPNAPGVNAWVALDEMPLEHGGGFALAVGSHTADWRYQAYQATGASVNYPDGGYTSAADLFGRRSGAGTCNLQQAAPHVHRRMEETSRLYNVQRGDVLFHTRWLFHRTVPFHRDHIQQQFQSWQQKQQREHQPSTTTDVTCSANTVDNEVNSNRQDDPLLLSRRYSIRYGPGWSIIPPGYGTELSVLFDPSNGGVTADYVSQISGPWYPQAWPAISQHELRQWPTLLQNYIPVAQQRQTLRKSEMRPYQRQLSRQTLQQQRAKARKYARRNSKKKSQ